MKLFELRHVLAPSVAYGSVIKEQADGPHLGSGPETWRRYMYREVMQIVPRTVRTPVHKVGLAYVPSLTVLLKKGEES